MQNIITYYYGIIPDKIIQKSKEYFIIADNERYLFLPFSRPENEIKALYKLNLACLKNNIPVHQIIINKMNNISTDVNGNPYVLMRIVAENSSYNLSTINALVAGGLGINVDKDLVRTDSISLWSAKVDYFEYQVNQMGKQNPLIADSFGYYLGMAENAISYTAYTIKEAQPDQNDIPVLSHRRLFASRNSYDLLNPINLIFDHRSRDIAEYVKTAFFSGQDVGEELIQYLNWYPLSPYGNRLLIGRLLFPTYYFDVYERIMANLADEDDLLEVIKKADDYQLFLTNIINYLGRRSALPPVEWLRGKRVIEER